MAELKALQNGSDIRGIALDTEEQTATLTATAVADCGGRGSLVTG